MEAAVDLGKGGRTECVYESVPSQLNVSRSKLKLTFITRVRFELLVEKGVDVWNGV